MRSIAASKASKFLVDVVNMQASVATGGWGDDGGRLGRPQALANEKRRGPRIRVKALDLSMPRGRLRVPGNVSVGGIGIEVRECVDLAPGDAIVVWLSIPDSLGPIELRVKLTHYRFIEAAGRFYGGGYFFGMDALSESPLYRFIEESALAERAKMP